MVLTDRRLATHRKLRSRKAVQLLLTGWLVRRDSSGFHPCSSPARGGRLHGDNGAGSAEARTAALNLFVVVEAFYLFSCRSLTRSA